MSHVLIVLTSHDRLGDTARASGFYYDELATPYAALADAGHDITLASIAGGAPAHDPSSLADDPEKRPEAVRRFLADDAAMARLSNTVSVSALEASDFDAVFLPGGHGTMFDFAQSEALGALVGRIFDVDGVVAAVCHGPTGLVGAVRADGRPLVEGLRVNAFTDAEEAAVGLVGVVPYLLESRLRELGARFESGPNFGAYAVRDGRLITGQNPASAGLVAQHLLDALDDARHGTRPARTDAA